MAVIIETKCVKINVDTISEKELTKLKKENNELYNLVKKYKNGMQ